VTDPLSHHERIAILAAEFALGLLDDGERAVALRLVEEDEAFAAEVIRWQLTIEASIVDTVDDAVAPADLWDRIASITGQPGDKRKPVADSIQVSPLWRITALAASLAAIVFASLWLTSHRQAALPARIQTVAAPLTDLSVAQIQDAGDERLLAVVYDRRTGRLLARLASLDAKGSVPELWLIGSDGKPRSLGTTHSGGEIQVTLPPQTRRLFADGATIAISLEPSDQSLHDAPKGPILGSAKISAI
jgi:anti-sigma-K factor RskA